MACFRGNREEFYGEILLLDETTLTLTSEGGFGKRTKAAAVLEQVCSHLSLVQVRFFGLRFCDDKQQTQWLDPLKTLHQHRDLLGPPYIFYFGVRFYSEDPSKLTDEAARYQFFLQVRQDVRRGRLACPAHLKPRLSALMMLSERDERSDAERNQEDPQAQISRASRPQAQGHFLSLCSSLQMFGVFLFTLYGENQTEYLVGPSPAGVVIYRSKTLVGKYVWQKITKLHFKNETFELRVRRNGSETSFFFQAADRSDCKRLWKCCVEHHMFRLSESSEFQRKHKYNSLTRLNVGMWKNKSGSFRTADVCRKRHSVGQAEHISSEPVRVQTAPPAVQRLDRGEQERLKPGAPWEISGSFSGLFNPKFPPNIKDNKDQHDRGSVQKSRSLDGDRPIRERARRYRCHGNTSSGGESERVSSECCRRRTKHRCQQGGRSPDTACRCRARSRSPDAVTWRHVQKQLVDPDGLIDRQTEEIPYKEVRVSAEPIKMRRSHRGCRRHRWTSATDLESKMELVPPLPVTMATDTSCGLPRTSRVFNNIIDSLR